MASCPAKYNNNEDSLALLQHNPLKSSYDPHMSTKFSVPSINENTIKLFEVEINKIEGINSDISSHQSTNDSDLDIGSPHDLYTMITMKVLIIPMVN